MENAWMPKVAGILDIVAGSFGILISFFLALWFAVFYYFIPTKASEFHDFPMQFMAILMAFWGIFILAAGILAIVGGIHGLRKKRWALALAGSIAAFFGSSPLGVAAIIFTVLSKKEFE
jgi:hypothetical protein